jgi:hypothetical protein
MVSLVVVGIQGEELGVGRRGRLDLLASADAS